MADAIYFSAKMLGGGQIGDTVTEKRLPAIFGKGSLPARLRSFTHGTGANQVNKLFVAQRTLATLTFDNLDLAGGLNDYNGAAITFTFLKWAYIAIVSPDGTKSLRVGPQNQLNALPGGWGGVGATVYQTLYTDWEDYRPITGHAVTAGTGDIFPIYNPGAGNVTYAILLAGLG